MFYVNKQPVKEKKFTVYETPKDKKVDEESIVRSKVVKKKDLLTMDEIKDCDEKFKKYDKDNSGSM
jgi:hypothetical protein